MTNLYETFVGEKIVEHKVGDRFFAASPLMMCPGVTGPERQVRVHLLWAAPEQLGGGWLESCNIDSLCLEDIRPSFKTTRNKFYAGPWFRLPATANFTPCLLFNQTMDC